MKLLFLTAKVINGNTLLKPRVVSVNPSEMTVFPGTNGKTKVREFIDGTLRNVYIVYESPAEIKAQQLVDDGQGTTINAVNYVDLSIPATGANAAAAVDVTKHITEIDDGTATTADGVQLDAATPGKVRQVLNNTDINTSIALEMWPQTGENFDGSADDAAIAQAEKTRKHYVCEVAGTWIVADDYTG